MKGWGAFFGKKAHAVLVSDGKKLPVYTPGKQARVQAILRHHGLLP